MCVAVWVVSIHGVEVGGTSAQAPFSRWVRRRKIVCSRGSSRAYRASVANLLPPQTAMTSARESDTLDSKS